MLNNSFDLRFCDHLLYPLESSLRRSSSPTARRCHYWRRCLQRCLRWKQRRWRSASLPSSVLKARFWLFQIQYFASEYGLLWITMKQVMTGNLFNLCLLLLKPPLVSITGAGSEVALPPATEAPWLLLQVPGARCNFMAFGLYLTPFLAQWAMPTQW